MRWLTPLLAAVIIASPGSPASAANVDVDNYGAGAVMITGQSPGSPGNLQNALGPQWFGYRRVAIIDGRLCWAYRSTTDPSEAAPFNYAYSPEMLVGDGLARLPDCPRAPAPAPPTPGDLARDFWDVRHLPSPTLEVVPDYAVTGKPVYLTIKGAPTATFEVANPIGPAVAISATSRYVVDWGDGTPPTTTTSQGGRWPDGDITHVYDGAGTTRTITVTQSWSATWSAPGTTGGVLDNLQTVGSLPIRVEQVQAVRNR